MALAVQFFHQRIGDAFGQCPRGGPFAAQGREQSVNAFAGMIHQFGAAADAIGALAAIGHQRPQAGIGEQHIFAPQLRRRQIAVDDGEEGFDIAFAHRHRARIVLEFTVGGADQGVAAPGHDKEMAVACIQGQGMAVRHCGDEEMNALGTDQLVGRRPAHCVFQEQIAPRSHRQQHGPGADVETRAGEAVHRFGADRLAFTQDQLIGAQMVGQRGAMRGGVDQVF